MPAGIDENGLQYLGNDGIRTSEDIRTVSADITLSDGEETPVVRGGYIQEGPNVMTRVVDRVPEIVVLWSGEAKGGGVEQRGG